MGSNRKIDSIRSFLIIEDEPLFRLAYEKQLRDFWPEATYYKAESSTEGLAILNNPQNEIPDVIILDFHLANSETGIQFLEHEFVRDLPESTKIIVCSSLATKDDRNHLLVLNKNCQFLAKPSTKDELFYQILK